LSRGLEGEVRGKAAAARSLSGRKVVARGGPAPLWRSSRRSSISSSSRAEPPVPTTSTKETFGISLPIIKDEVKSSVADPDRHQRTTDPDPDSCHRFDNKPAKCF